MYVKDKDTSSIIINNADYILSPFVEEQKLFLHHTLLLLLCLLDSNCPLWGEPSIVLCVSEREREIGISFFKNCWLLV